MPKKRVNLYLDEELYDRTKVLTDQVPGFSVSAIVNEVLELGLPHFEAILEAAKSGNGEAAIQVLQFMGAEGMEKLDVGIHTIREKVKELEDSKEAKK